MQVLKKKSRWLFILPGLLFCFAVFGQEETKDKLVLDLSGAWGMEGVLPGEGVKKQFHLIEPDCGSALVPGDVYTDLWRVGRIDDPHFGMNSQRAKWAMDYEWWYFKKFNLPKDMEGKEENLKIGKVGGDSSKEVADISVEVPGEKGDMFHVEMSLLDKDGNSLSENEYFLLVDDQEEARAMMLEMNKEASARSNRAMRTIRYFPKLMGDLYVPTKLIKNFK